MGGTPYEVRLTHPASWNRPRLNRLLEAAAKAGLDKVSLVPEPVGAALFYASEIGVEAGSQVAVYDLGGGTFDSAVVTSTGSGFTIIGRPGGDQTIGGELFDEILFNHVGEQLPADAWYEIQVGEDPEWQQAGAALRNEVRRAKEALSAHPVRRPSHFASRRSGTSTGDGGGVRAAHRAVHRRDREPAGPNDRERRVDHRGRRGGVPRRRGQSRPDRGAGRDGALSGSDGVTSG